MSNQKFFTNERETYCEIQCKKNLPVMKEEVDVQIFHVYHILRKFDRRKITSRHVQSFKFQYEKKKKNSGMYTAKASHFHGKK